MLQEFHMVRLLLSKFVEQDESVEKNYAETFREFENLIFSEMKSRVFHVNRSIVDLHQRIQTYMQG